MFSLVARISLDDNFSSPMQKVEKQLARNKRMMDQVDNATSKVSTSISRASRGHDGFSKSVGGLTRGLGSLKTALFGAVAGYAAYEGAKKVFESTVGKAMEREVSAITIDAMFETEAASRAYQKMMKEMALESPVLSYGDMAGGSKRVLALTRDAKVLENVWKNVEKLQAFAPDKTTDEAIRGISELAAGDIVSLKEVFNLDKVQLNALKDLTFEEQVAGLDKMLKGMKITDELIAKVGGTTAAKLNQVKEKFEDVFAKIGTPSLDVMSTFFDNILSRLEVDGDKFAAVGGSMVKGILTGLTEATVDIYDWFTNLVSSEEYKKKTTVYGKVSFVIDDIFKNFKDWLDETGYKKIANVSQVALETLAAGFDAALPAIMPVLGKIGEGIGNGLIAGFNEAVEDSTFLQFFASPQRKVEIKNNKVSESLGQKGAQGISDFTKKAAKKKKAPKKNGGLAYVPYNGYEASLHKGEQVLNRGQADEYRAGKSGGNTYKFGDIYISGVGGDMKAAARQLMAIIADEIEASGGAGASWA